MHLLKYILLQTILFYILDAVSCLNNWAILHKLLARSIVRCRDRWIVEQACDKVTINTVCVAGTVVEFWVGGGWGGVEPSMVDWYVGHYIVNMTHVETLVGVCCHFQDYRLIVICYQTNGHSGSYRYRKCLCPTVWRVVSNGNLPLLPGEWKSVTKIVLVTSQHRIFPIFEATICYVHTDHAIADKSLKMPNMHMLAPTALQNNLSK